MSDAVRLLEQIEEQILAHGGDLGGWTRLADGALQLFDGRVTLTVVIPEQVSSSLETVHIHVLTRLHDYDEEILEACLFGMGGNREEALRQAAGIWVTSVAGPIRSFLDGNPVCTTCQAGVADGDLAQGYSEADYGLSGLRAYVGPVVVRGTGDDDQTTGFSDNMPWFRFAGESAAPRRVHLAKATVVFRSSQGWCRELEVDGHEVSYQDYDWPSPGAGPVGVYATRFAVFEFPRNSTEMRRRMELERTIRHFADNLARYDSADQLARKMVERGFDADIVHEV
ncbi:MAG: hypothetical protein JSS02_20045, partial [Planctomycetes bacterium]|nr:hypothetical protein [Planctomycetota bacterium]